MTRVRLEALWADWMWPPPEPVDRPPVLLIANSQNVLATFLSGTPVPNITPTSAKHTTAMDFNYVEDTVCWVHMGDAAAQTVLKCAKIPNLKGFVEERSINISLSLHRKCRCRGLEGSCLPSCQPQLSLKGYEGSAWISTPILGWAGGRVITGDVIRGVSSCLSA